MSKPKKPYFSQSRQSSSAAKNAETCTSPSTSPCEQEVMEILATQMAQSGHPSTQSVIVAHLNTLRPCVSLQRCQASLCQPTSPPPIQHTPEKLGGNCSREN